MENQQDREPLTADKLGQTTFDELVGLMNDVYNGAKQAQAAKQQTYDGVVQAMISLPFNPGLPFLKHPKTQAVSPSFGVSNLKVMLSSGNGLLEARVVALLRLYCQFEKCEFTKVERVCEIIKRESFATVLKTQIPADRAALSQRRSELPFRLFRTLTVKALKSPHCAPLNEALRHAIADALDTRPGAQVLGHASEQEAAVSALVLLHSTAKPHLPLAKVLLALKGIQPLTDPAGVEAFELAACRLFQLALMRAVVADPGATPEEFDKALVMVRADSQAMAVLLAAAAVGGDVRFELVGIQFQSAHTVNVGAEAISPGSQSEQANSDLGARLLCQMTGKAGDRRSHIPAKFEVDRVRQAVEIEREVHNRHWRLIAQTSVVPAAGSDTLAQTMFKQLGLHTVVFDAALPASATHWGDRQPVVEIGRWDMYLQTFLDDLHRISGAGAQARPAG